MQDMLYCVQRQGKPDGNKLYELSAASSPETIRTRTAHSAGGRKMKYYEVGFDAGVCYSCNIIQGETEAACRYAAEQHAKQYGYTVGYFEEIAESALEYNRKPVWNADRYQQPETDPEQPETETAEAAQNEEESTMQNNVNMIRTAEAAHIAKCAEYIRNSVHTIGDYRRNWCAQRYTTPAQTRRLLAMQDADEMPAADLTKILDKQDRNPQERGKRCCRSRGADRIPEAGNVADFRPLETE